MLTGVPAAVVRVLLVIVPGTIMRVPTLFPNAPYLARFCTVIELGNAAANCCKPVGSGVSVAPVPMDAELERTHSRVNQALKNHLSFQIGPEAWVLKTVSRYLGGLVKPEAR